MAKNVTRLNANVKKFADFYHHTGIFRTQKFGALSRRRRRFGAKNSSLGCRISQIGEARDSTADRLAIELLSDAPSDRIHSLVAITQQV